MSKGKKALKVLGIIFGSLIALIIMLNIILNIVFGIQLRNKIAELKAQGKPMTIAEIVPLPVPDKDNAAILYNKAFALMGSTEGQISEMIKTIDFSDISGWTDEQKQQISQIVNSRDTQYIYELLEEGSQKPKCNFNHKYEKGFEMLLPHLSPMRNTTRLLCTKAILEAESGNASKAFDTLLIALKISNHLKDEPTLVSQLVRIACDGIIIECIENMSDSKGIPVEKATLIMNELSTHQGVEPFIKGTDIDRVGLGMWALERILRGKPKDLRELIDATSPSSMPWAVIISFLGKPIFKKDFISYLTLMSKAQDSYHQPYYKIVQETTKYESIPKYCIFTNMLLPAIGRVREMQVRHQAYIDICRTGLALKIYKAKNGNYPGKLENLVPEFLKEVPTDPFSGENLKYSCHIRGFELYSIGPNMQDDYGTDAKEKKWEGDYDIVWESKN